MAATTSYRCVAVALSDYVPCAVSACVFDLAFDKFDIMSARG